MRLAALSHFYFNRLYFHLRLNSVKQSAGCFLGMGKAACTSFHQYICTDT
ncbi:hypothetical protein HMPREF9098_1457 [Kingella denitrificans ATCC 33394]|uniref:Uncharacterized protein n=1 Tax=Kingella denitrificans ATCC 33394 TaxID=888741 RepID=F0F023_9NEIS|nr:hypothetical protein HMPREF9098_1457 [Kingella denitrificans ATCC 33394]